MPRRVHDLEGLNFGRLSVSQPVDLRRHGIQTGNRRESWWWCDCSCGRPAIVKGCSLRGHTRSCGCLRRKHGMSDTGEYNSWYAMRARCFNPRTPAWNYYGGRGITVCDRWRSFENFFQDMGPRPPRHSLPPTIETLDNQGEEIKTVSKWISNHANSGVLPHEFGLFVRSTDQLDRAKSAAKAAGIPFKILDESIETGSGYLSIGTMHLAKGLEFRAVAVMACDDEIIPLQQRIETVGDDADLEEVYDTERHLLYVACTRARDYLLISGATPVSEFLDDLFV